MNPLRYLFCFLFAGLLLVPAFAAERVTLDNGGQPLTGSVASFSDKEVVLRAMDREYRIPTRLLSAKDLYNCRRSMVDFGEPKGVLELAAFCREQKLTREAEKLLEQAVQVNPAAYREAYLEATKETAKPIEEKKPNEVTPAAETPKADPATLPMIFWHSQPVRPGQTLMLSGANLNPGTLIEVCRLPDGDPGRPTPFDASAKGLNWQPLGLLQLTPQLAQGAMPNGKESVYACRVRNGGLIGAARLVNAPHVWFAQGDQGETASPGGWIGVFGTCIAQNSNPLPAGIRSETEKPKANPLLGPVATPRAPQAAVPGVAPGEPQTRMALVARGQTVRVLTARMAGGTRYGQFFDVPADCPLGTFDIYVHNGNGGPQGWTRLAQRHDDQLISTITIAVPEEWPNNGVDVTKMPGANDDERFAKAISASKGGGIILVPAGTYRLTQSLVLPHKTILRGAGMDKTKVAWTADPKDGQGKPLPLIRGAEQSRKNSTDRRASFSLEDISLQATANFGGHVIERENASLPAHFRRVAVRMPRTTACGPILNLNCAHNTEITGCDFDGYSDIGFYKDVAYLRCTDNRLRWRGMHIWLMRNHDNIIYMHNQLTMTGTWSGNGFTEAMNANPGMSYAGYDFSNCQNLYYALNLSDREEAEPPHRSIGITFDGATPAYSGRVSSVSGTKIVLVGTTGAGDQYGHPPCDPGASVRIVSGRGAGQWRYLVSKQTKSVKEIEVDRAWDVEPDASSWLAVSNVLGGTLFVANRFTNDPLLQTYFSTEDVVFAENRIGVPGKKVEMPVWADADLNAWHYQVLDNEVTELGADMCCAEPGWNTPKDYQAPITGTQVYRNNRVTDSKAALNISVPHRIIGFLIEGNQGVSTIQMRNAKDALGVIRLNTNLKGTLIKPAPEDPKIVVAQ